MPIPPRLSLVTLGVADVLASERFYRALGWQVAVSHEDDFRLFDLDGAYLALFPASHLAADAGVPERTATDFRGVSCAINLESEAAVDDAFRVVAEAGGTVVKPPERVFWGGYSGYFADPDGHAWEIAHNPNWPIGTDGRPTLPN